MKLRSLLHLPRSYAAEHPAASSPLCRTQEARPKPSLDRTQGRSIMLPCRRFTGTSTVLIIWGWRQIRKCRKFTSSSVNNPNYWCSYLAEQCNQAVRKLNVGNSFQHVLNVKASSAAEVIGIDYKYKLKPALSALMEEAKKSKVLKIGRTNQSAKIIT